MPKNADESKSRMRLKSTRKPLRNVSNANPAIKSAVIYKKISKDDGGQAGDDSLDRLLLVHSDLSSLTRQIDELVIEALQLTGNDRRKEIKQFADALSDMQTSLKPWVSRFQKAVLSQSKVPDNNSEQPVERKALNVSKASTNTAAESPEESKWESLVSPSPLVSWRAECNTESGRQLFLLTPMPQRKAFLSKYQASSSLLAVEKIPSEAAHPVSLSDAVRNLGNDLQEGASAKPTPKMAFDVEVTKAAVHTIIDCCLPEKVSNTSIMTPCMKMSPQKSCILLEPISAFSRKKSQVVHKSTPYPTGVHSFSDFQDSESSSDHQSSDDLKLKYPELYGIKKENMQKKMAAEDSPNWIGSPPKTCAVMTGVPSFSDSQDSEPSSDHRSSDYLKQMYPELYGIRKENLQKKMSAEDSPNWIGSPPKTCAIMYPSDELLLKNRPDHCLLLKTTAVSNHEPHFPVMKAKESKGGHATTSKSTVQDIIRTFDLAEFTPMMKEPMSSMRMGKKHPGENTLKKELWMKFDAATTHDFCFSHSLVRHSTKKGFLDILDEASDA